MPNRPLDLAGKRIGRLLAIEISGKRKKANTWLCLCDCGNYCHVVAHRLNVGTTRSCGCFQDESRLTNGIKHGYKNTLLYKKWSSMKSRCKDKEDKDYGGRGITYCNEWEKFEPFLEWALANGYFVGSDLTLDCIEVNGNYEPSNCRWVTMKEQANNKRNNHMVEVFGVRMTLTEAVEKYATVSLACVQMRLNRKDSGYTFEEALFLPNINNWDYEKSNGEWRFKGDVSRGKYKDISGRSFGRLVAKEVVGPPIKRGPIWRCLCSCGNTKDIPLKALTDGETKSCGCLRKEMNANNLNARSPSF